MNIFITKKIKESGLKLKSVADMLGITYVSLYNKLGGSTDFKLSEIRKLFGILSLDEEEAKKVFFGSCASSDEAEEQASPKGDQGK